MQTSHDVVVGVERSELTWYETAHSWIHGGLPMHPLPNDARPCQLPARHMDAWPCLLTVLSLIPRGQVRAIDQDLPVL